MPPSCLTTRVKLPMILLMMACQISSFTHMFVNNRLKQTSRFSKTADNHSSQGWLLSTTAGQCWRLFVCTAFLILSFFYEVKQPHGCRSSKAAVRLTRGKPCVGVKGLVYLVYSLYTLAITVNYWQVCSMITFGVTEE